MPSLSRAEMSALLQRVREGKVNVPAPLVGVCPNCHGRVVEYDREYGCYGPRSCDFSLRKAALRSLGKEIITRAEMEALLSDEIIDLPGLIGKKGPFDCGGRLTLTTDHGWAIEFCGRPRSPRRVQGPTSSGPVPKGLQRRGSESRQEQEVPRPEVAEGGEQRTSNLTPPKLKPRLRTE